MCKTTKQLTYEERFVENIYKIQELLKNFLKDIVRDCYEDTDDIYYKVGLENTIYKVGLYSKKTGKTVIKNYELNNFLMLMTQPNKVELEMNMLVREMLLKLEEVTEEKIINI